MLRMICAAAIAAAMVLVPTSADAKRTARGLHYDNDGRATQTVRAGSAGRRLVASHRQVEKRRVAHPAARAAHRSDRQVLARAIASGRPSTGNRAHVVGGRPAGCPSLYCACATSLRVFGRIVPGLNLSDTWLERFARAAPAPQMVAVRPRARRARGHVMVLLEQVDGRRWRVWDANSGHGLTRIHVRSIAGFAIVDPRAPRVAQRR